MGFSDGTAPGCLASRSMGGCTADTYRTKNDPRVRQLFEAFPEVRTILEPGCLEVQ